MSPRLFGGGGGAPLQKYCMKGGPHLLHDVAEKNASACVERG